MSTIDSSPRAPGSEADETTPPVAVVLVAHDPGPWFEEVLASIAAQTYGQLATLVVDAGDTADLDARVASVLPSAAVVHPDEVDGFGQAANVALTAVAGATFLLLCHDDVRLDPDAVTQLVAEAYRSNAGVVGPKLVDWHHPERLTQVGLGADKFGALVPLVEPGEIDQEQHDSVRDVFVVPGGVMLVRADLFGELGGFDRGIVGFGDDLDLCWRAHTVGARVLVAPAARAAHREELASRTAPVEARATLLRHRIRTVCVTTSAPRRWGVLAQFALIGLIQVVAALVLGRPAVARALAGAWVWNLRRLGEIRRRRAALRRVRHVRDRDVRRYQVRGSYELTAFVRGRIGVNEDRLVQLAGSGRGFAASARAPGARYSVVAWLLVLAVLVVGSRDLLFTPIPSVGEFYAFPSSPTTLARLALSEHRRVGLGVDGPGPSLLAALALAGFGVGGLLELLRQLLLLGLLPLGAIGMWRFARPIASRRSRVAALVMFLVIPVPYNALAEGRWGALLLWALAPWQLHQLALAARVAPFGPVGGDAGPGVISQPLAHRALVLGLLTGVGMLLVPAAALWLVALALVLVLGGLVAGQVAGALRMIGVAVAAGVVAVVLHLPWALGFVPFDPSSLTGVTSLGGDPLGLSGIVRFATGPVGDSAFGWLLLPAPLLALLIGRSWRLAWAVRGWVLALVSWTLVFLGSRGHLAGFLPPAEALLAPAAAGLALAAGLGAAAFEVDLPGYRFGWRQVVSLFAAMALFGATGPIIVAATDGSWHLPRQSFRDGPLAFLDEEGRIEPFRVLWIGDADRLPMPGWQLDEPRLGSGRPGDVLAWATVEDGNPTVEQAWTGPAGGATRELPAAIRTAAAGDTDRLGALLAPMGVKYVIVPTARAPGTRSQSTATAPEGLRRLLDAQLDLASVELDANLTVYRNTAFGPIRAVLPAGTTLPGGGRALADRTAPQLSGAPHALDPESVPTSFSGRLDEPATLYLGTTATDRWELRVDGSPVPRLDAFGWANQWSVPAGGEVTLTYDEPLRRPLLLAGQTVLWVLSLAVLARRRVRRLRVDDPSRVEPADVATESSVAAPIGVAP